MLMTRTFLVALPLLLLQAGATSYQEAIEQWQHRYEAALRADDGWLTLAGLFWLKEGENTIGTDRKNSFVLPKGSAPILAGVFEFHDGTTSFQPAVGANFTLNGQPLGSRVTLKADSSGSPDVLRLNDLTMFIIQRGNRFGIRVKDRDSPTRKAFAGLKYFPIDEQYRVTARFVPYDSTKKIAVPNILGDTEEESSPGYVEFTLNGRKCRLDPVSAGDQLFFIFRDLTSGKTTYPSGRFLYTDLPKNGEVVLDFNKAVNPPCAFTPFATCPLPPRQNRLPVRVEAGELRYGH
jgi:uncharacterized protein (DUF1684 family)